jgi:glycosyltransferase involved in cell wall biosynthesis
MTTDTVGGVWNYSLSLAAELIAAHGLRVALAAVGPAPSAAQQAEVAALPGLAFHACPGRLEWQPGCASDLAASARRLRDLAAELDVALIHSNQFAYGALTAGRPVLVAAHSDLFSWHAACQPLDGPVDPGRRAFLEEYRRVVVAGLRGAAAVVCPSRFVAAGLRAHYGVSVPIEVIYNGIAPPAAKEAAAPLRAGPARRVLTVGRLWDPAKNLAWLLEAVGDGIPGLEIAVAGSLEGPDGETAPPAGPLRVLGALPHTALMAEMAAADVYVGMSRYEPFGLAPLEAAARGCALLLSDVPSFREIWGRAARYCRSAADLRAALLDLAAGAIPARQAARQRAARYTIARTAAAYARLYARLGVAARGTRARGPHGPRAQDRTATPA